MIKPKANRKDARRFMNGNAKTTIPRKSLIIILEVIKFNITAMTFASNPRAMPTNINTALSFLILFKMTQHPIRIIIEGAKDTSFTTIPRKPVIKKTSSKTNIGRFEFIYTSYSFPIVPSAAKNARQYTLLVQLLWQQPRQATIQ